jgi:hypothetical protein
MSEPSQPKRRSRGFFWRRMRVGDAVGKPLAEWAYTTPRYPGGLVVSDLRIANEGVQRETALVWFTANLKPFELGPGPWFGFAEAVLPTAIPAPIGGPRIAGFDEGFWAPSPLRAGDVLKEQFEGDLPDALIQALGAALGDNWMWMEPETPAQPDDDVQSSKSALQADLDAVEDIIRSFIPAHGGIGHNAPDEEAPLTAEEHAVALAAIGRIRAGLAAEPTSADEVKAGTLGLAEVWQKLGRYVLKQADLFITEANKAVAQKVPHLLGATVIGWGRIEHLLGSLWQFLAHLPPS